MGPNVHPIGPKWPPTYWAKVDAHWTPMCGQVDVLRPKAIEWDSKTRPRSNFLLNMTRPENSVLTNVRTVVVE